MDKQKLLSLFDQGKMPTDPEVKGVGYKSSTTRKLYSQWKSGKASKATSKNAGKATDEKGGKATGKATAELETFLPGGEVIGGYDETKKSTALKEGKTRQEDQGGDEEPEAEEGKEEQKFQLVYDRGIAVKIVLSLRTLVYYRMSATVEEEGGGKLELGDFLDGVTQDYFEGRGLSLGLVKLEK